MADQQLFKQNFLFVRVLNPLMRFMIQRVGFGPPGVAVLSVRTRKSGRIQRNPVSPVEVDGTTYLVSPFGLTQWVLNLRAAGEADLTRRRQTEHIAATELPDSEKVPVLRTYIAENYTAVGKQVGVPRDATDTQLADIAPRLPVFRINE